jgi:hypothetical protein
METGKAIRQVAWCVEGDYVEMVDGISIKDLSIATLLGIAILLIIIGRLIPWWQYKEKCKESDRWREAYEKERESRLVMDKQNAELLEFARASYSILDALFVNTTEFSRQGGAHRVVPTSR